MNELKIINKDGQLLVESREVAEMVDKRHSDLIRSIDNFYNVLLNAKMRPADFFITDSYKDGSGKENRCYLLTKKGCDMVANKLTGEKGILFTAAYVTRFEEMENSLRKQDPFSQIEIIATGTTQLNKRVEKLETFFDERLTVDYGQQLTIKNAVGRRVYKLWDDGTVNTTVHDNKKKLFSAIWKDVKVAFAVNSYCNIRQKDFEEALSYINAWRPRLV